MHAPEDVVDGAAVDGQADETGRRGSGRFKQEVLGEACLCCWDKLVGGRLPVSTGVVELAPAGE